ncbi:MAG: glutamine synthetase III [Solirubrobacterales bacterium]
MKTRQQNVQAAQWSSNGGGADQLDLTQSENKVFGADVFGPEVQRRRLSKQAYKDLQRALATGQSLNPELADQIATAMKDWAMERGATHYTHWFQPLTGSTAEKHDSFFTPDRDGDSLAEFSGKELIQGEPDASSFPSGGLRATFEARGYTAWDPTSPAFLLRNPNGSVLCIPTAFASWKGEALDLKIPLLRSMDVLSTAALRALRLFGDDTAERVFSTVGPEQEYFLIDEQYFYERPDLIATGRTLFGAEPARGHELDDHYFGSIPERVLACMLEAERELAMVGVPIKTRHNEVAPAQYEVAPVFENSNVCADHQHLTMQILKNVARRYGLVCLMHEKPFAGVNGSGKHNNWAIATDAGHNLFDPGDTPAENLQFLFFATAVISAVFKHQGLLRASIADAGNDHRLGANEAPPAIISIFLGDELREVFEAIEQGETAASTEGSFLGLGTASLPPLPRHGGDRNRTSPFAFVGSRFEFRAVGSSQSISVPNTVLNTIAAQAIDSLCDELEKATADGTSLDEAVPGVLQKAYTDAKAIVFEGDGYSEEWHREAEQRGLLNLRTTPDALPYFTAPETIEAFSAYNVLSEVELKSRLDVAREQYMIKVNIEGETAAHLGRTLLMPAALRYLAQVKQAGVAAAEKPLSEGIDAFASALDALDEANAAENQPEGDLQAHAEYMRDKVLPAMDEVRATADLLEGLVADDLWPLPKYSEVLWIK